MTTAAVAVAAAVAVVAVAAVTAAVAAATAVSAYQQLHEVKARVVVCCYCYGSSAVQQRLLRLRLDRGLYVFSV
jgi:hypothetical protein